MFVPLASVQLLCAAMGQAFGKWWTGVTTEWHDFFEKAGWAAADPLEDVGLPFKGVDFGKDFEVMQLLLSFQNHYHLTMLARTHHTLAAAAACDQRMYPHAVAVRNLHR
jgi:hypothetical protein